VTVVREEVSVPQTPPLEACMVTVLLAVEGRATTAGSLAWPSAVRPRVGGRAPGGAAVAVADDLDRDRDELDASVLRRAQRGDRDAFVQLMEHYDRRLRSLVYRLLDDRDAAVDAMQDVYVKAFAGLPGFQGRSSVGTWLYRIAYTTCLDHLERRKRRTAVFSDAEPPSLYLVRDPADEVSLHADLAAALRSLSSEARAAVLLVDRDGYDYRTASAVLGIPMGTLASRLSAARAVLRTALEGEEVSR
jgi:RNA polymerase sigma-70 factor, ECF subfamily